MTLGFGVTSTIDLELVQRIAPTIEQAGFNIFWSNDIPGGSSFDVLAAFAGVTSNVRLANGVVPIDRVPASEWRNRLDRAGLGADRMIAGIGSGGMKRPIEPLRDAIAEIRESTGLPIVLGALRKHMRHLAAASADGVLLNWLTPEFAALRQEEMASIRRDEGQSGPFLNAAFVRVGIGDNAIARLRHEAEKYESFPSYSKHFREMGVGAFDASIAASSVSDAADGLVEFMRAYDHPVLRCVVGDEVDKDYLALIEAGKLALERR